jgi:membrane protein YqaA with SNARE-associated domain
MGLLFLATLDSAGLPIVGGVDALLAVLGSLAGSLVLFFIARKGGEVVLMRHVTSTTGATMHLWFQRWGLATVFIPAIVPFIPLPMKVPVFCAGALQVRLLYFVTVIVVARTVRYFGLAYLGVHYGTETFQFVKSHVWPVVIFAILLAALFTMAMRLFQKHELEIGIPE